MKARLADIHERIARACDAAGRDPAEVTLIAVSKNHPVEALREAYDLGQRHFGESRLQEALPKIAALPDDIVWHFIGRLQSNKARRAAENFQVIHTLESEAQLREIQEAERDIDGLVEINIAEEPQKTGLTPTLVDGFLKMLLQYPHVHFRGLMTVGPALEDAERMRPFFRELRDLNRQAGGQWLSMGMSGDFEVAIQEGATHVRIGTAIFGAREYSR